MDATRAPAANPIEDFADSVPAVYARAAVAVGLLFGAALALYVATDQSYDRTQLYTAGLAVLMVIAAAALLMPALSAWLPPLAAGALFFAGALLWSHTAGMAMLPLGAFAALAALVANRRAGRPGATGIGMFFFGLGLAVAGVGAVLFTVEG